MQITAHRTSKLDLVFVLSDVLNYNYTEIWDSYSTRVEDVIRKNINLDKDKIIEMVNEELNKSKLVDVEFLFTELSFLIPRSQSLGGIDNAIKKLDEFISYVVEDIDIAGMIESQKNEGVPL